MSKSYLTTAQNVHIGLHYGGLASRGLAMAIDLVVINLYLYGLDIVNGLTRYSLISGWIMPIIFFVLPIMGYFLLADLFFNGRTVGKRIMGLRVVSLNAMPLGIGQAVIRFLLLPFDLFMSFGLGPILIAFTARHQRIGDLAAGTTVIDERAYRRNHVSLQAFETAEAAGYQPRYALAAELTSRQAEIIDNALSASGTRRADRLAKLALKVEATCGPRVPQEPTPETYLTRILSDYRHYKMAEAE